DGCALATEVFANATSGPDGSAEMRASLAIQAGIVDLLRPWPNSFTRRACWRWLTQPARIVAAARASRKMPTFAASQITCLCRRRNGTFAISHAVFGTGGEQPRKIEIGEWQPVVWIGQKCQIIVLYGSVLLFLTQVNAIRSAQVATRNRPTFLSISISGRGLSLSLLGLLASRLESLPSSCRPRCRWQPASSWAWINRMRLAIYPQPFCQRYRLVRLFAMLPAAQALAHAITHHQAG